MGLQEFQREDSWNRGKVLGPASMATFATAFPRRDCDWRAADE